MQPYGASVINLKPGQPQKDNRKVGMYHEEDHLVKIDDMLSPLRSDDFFAAEYIWCKPTGSKA